MPQILSSNTTAVCPHGGKISFLTPAGRATILGQPAVVMTDACVVAGCANIPPCTVVSWNQGSSRVMAHGLPVLTTSSNGVCQAGGAATGPATIALAQSHAATSS